MLCRFCGKDGEGVSFVEWVKPTFTDLDKLKPGSIVCADCLFWFEEASPELASRVGKDKPQRMRNYSHFIVNDEWIPLSKGDKVRMIELLTTPPFPELAAIADSGQKHIVFRAKRNPSGGRAGYIQFEEQSLWIDPVRLIRYLNQLTTLLATFSKSEIETGGYLPYRIIQFGLERWQALEAEIKPIRGSLFFEVCLFLAQRKEVEDDTETPKSGGPARYSLARDEQRVQEQVSPNHLGAIREPGESQQLHQQPGQVRQLDLFEAWGDDTGEAD